MVFNISSITPSLLSIFNHSRKTAVRQLLKVKLSSSSGRSWDSPQFTATQLSTVSFLLVVSTIMIQFPHYFYTQGIAIGLPVVFQLQSIWMHGYRGPLLGARLQTLMPINRSPCAKGCLGTLKITGFKKSNT